MLRVTSISQSFVPVVLVDEWMGVDDFELDSWLFFRFPMLFQEGGIILNYYTPSVFSVEKIKENQT